MAKKVKETVETNEVEIVEPDTEKTSKKQVEKTNVKADKKGSNKKKR